MTSVTFGLGFQLGSTRTARLDEHLRDVSADGWRLVAVNQSGFEIPVAWRFSWERPRLPASEPEIADADARPVRVADERIIQRQG